MRAVIDRAYSAESFVLICGLPGTAEFRAALARRDFSDTPLALNGCGVTNVPSATMSNDFEPAVFADLSLWWRASTCMPGPKPFEFVISKGRGVDRELPIV
jgi:hypothetical protein